MRGTDVCGHPFVVGRHRWSELLAPKLGIAAGYKGPASSLYSHNSVNRSHASEELTLSEDSRAIAAAGGSFSDFGVGWTIGFAGRCPTKDTTALAISSSRGSVGSQSNDWS
jgi:hypothetical protein